MLVLIYKFLLFCNEYCVLYKKKSIKPVSTLKKKKSMLCKYEEYGEQITNIGTFCKFSLAYSDLMIYGELYKVKICNLLPSLKVKSRSKTC